MSLFTPNPNFITELQGQKEYVEGLLKVAESVKRSAVSVSPRKSGYYARRFIVTEQDGEVFVGNTDFAAHLVEYGSAKNSPYAPLRRGARAAGLRVAESEKK